MTKNGDAQRLKSCRNASKENFDPFTTPEVSRLVLIDNYDSFTWNIYQYLSLEGANVNVFRNDEISLEQLIALKPTQLVISPGPGSPELDSGISDEAIKHFAGQIPILGVCLGEQCIFTAFGGQVRQSGEILHGKTSPLCHDSKGVYAGLPQHMPVTRYHSLVGTHDSLPSCLEVSAWTASDVDQKGVIMGIRHKELLVEGVQFHPESILTTMGRTLLRNFLNMRGGTWEENERLQRAGTKHGSVEKVEANHKPFITSEPSQPALSNMEESILEKIYRHRQLSIQARRQTPSMTPSDLQTAYDLNLAPPQISFPDRLRQSPWPLALMAEFKRASPSKGLICGDGVASKMAKEYALAGASVISVLTEPEWFKGSIEDLRMARQSVNGMPSRPAILCKEFVFDEYQILEARLNGADTVLLIVKMLDEAHLRELYAYSKSLFMEPLVEVNNAKELEVAKSLGAKVIGINNRSLETFKVDLSTTTGLLADMPKETLVCALSGISGPDDVTPYRKEGVHALLIGEALMRAPSVSNFVDGLFHCFDSTADIVSRERTIIKICGIRTVEAATTAIEAGADIVSMILVQGRSRCVSQAVGIAISKKVHASSRPQEMARNPSLDQNRASEYFDLAPASLSSPNRALLCGVFQNQPLTYILEQQRLLDLDIVQLHGEEPEEWANFIPVPVIRRFLPGDPRLGMRGYHALPLLDSAKGGTGHLLDVQAVKKTLASDEGLRVVLAGGLDSSNVGSVLEQLGEWRNKVVGVDVASGVETGGVQDPDKIRGFVAAVRELERK